MPISYDIFGESGDYEAETWIPLSELAEVATMSEVSEDFDRVVRDIAEDYNGDRTPVTLMIRPITAAEGDTEGSSDGASRLADRGWIVRVLLDEEAAVDLPVYPREPRPLRVARIADRLQDELIEKSSSARPQCPLHVHPLSTALRDDRALWVCPQGMDGWCCEIGDYFDRRAEAQA